VSSPAVPVLTYHSVTSESVAGMEAWEVTPAVFAAQIGHLVDTGYDVIPLAQYARWLAAPDDNPLPPKPVVITFDDGYANFSHALEVLTRHRVTATMFVPTGYIGGTSSWNPSAPLSDMRVMSWEQLAEIRDAGIEIGAHAHVHRPLDEVAIRDVRDDVRRCKQILEDGLGTEVRGFAYPHGYYGARVRAEVVAAGYGYACAVRNSLSRPGDDPFAIARIFVETSGDLTAFDHLLAHGHVEFTSRERLATKAWRVTRRVRARVRTAG
jgi:peptidoglycan/xylan/chitin deacetylase (PgdA/CDA1 family)